MDFTTLDLLRQNHPAWRLLRSDNAPLVASFLNRAFIVPNVRTLAQADLVEALEDELYSLRERLGEKAFPRAALAYLNDWANNERGWLRKFYVADSDEPHFDLTPATEKAIAWLESLNERSFVGTESRLLTLFNLLREICEGSETDPRARIQELERRKAEIDAEIAQIQQGDIPLLDDTALRDRFQQFTLLARDLLGDFRQVEHNFRSLDRRVRERIALWEGSKGALLEEIMGERDAISDSDEGRSFRAFWDFLMSSRRQEELDRLLEQVLALPAVTALKPDNRTRRVHYDWLEAGEYTQRTVAQLSQQLRRFLDDQAWLENRRIMEILHSLESNALALREHPELHKVREIMRINDTGAALNLPTERPLYSPGIQARLDASVPESGDESLDTAVLFSQVVVDRELLRRQIRQALQDRQRITLAELCERYPLQHGLAELVSYLQLAEENFRASVDESVEESIHWEDSEAPGHHKQARLPRVIFLR